MRTRDLSIFICAFFLFGGCTGRGGAKEPASQTEEARSQDPAPGPPGDFTNGIGMRFVLIREGEFLMGSPETEARRNFDEGPRHGVRITRAFYMGATEVSQAQWRAVTGADPSHFKGDDLPVEHVSWREVEGFIEKLSEREGRSYRLPTEAEWEYACRAGTETPFSYGQGISPDQANYDGNYAYGGGRPGPFRERTVPVGSLAPNHWGLHEMHGNVHEWCLDWYDAWYYQKSPGQDPPGGAQMSDWSARILRGGSWEDPPWICRSAARHRDYPGYGDDFYGFRLVTEP